MKATKTSIKKISTTASTKGHKGKTPKQISRANKEKSLGKEFSINMHDYVKDRLREISVNFGHSDMMTREQKTGRIFSQTIMNIIDYYYITTIITPKKENTKLLIKAFKAVWKECISKKKIFILKKDFESRQDGKDKKRIIKSLELIANKMTKSSHLIPPYLLNNHFDNRDKNTWTQNDILNLLDTQTVINKIDIMEKQILL